MDTALCLTSLALDQRHLLKPSNIFMTEWMKKIDKS